MKSKQTKICTNCNMQKSIDDFFKRKASVDGLQPQCKECDKKRRKKHYLKYRAECIKSTALHAKAVRDEVIAAYGNKCACCGESNRVFLSLDHVNGGGHKHRYNSRMRHYWDAKKRHFPSDYQVLCFNCNWAKHALGKCPHQFQLTMEGIA